MSGLIGWVVVVVVVVGGTCFPPHEASARIKAKTTKVSAKIFYRKQSTQKQSIRIFIKKIKMCVPLVTVSILDFVWQLLFQHNFLYFSTLYLLFIHYSFFFIFYKKAPCVARSFFLFCNRVYTPGSVLNGHLSSLIVTDKLRGFPRATLQICVGPTSALGVASSRVYSGSMLPQKRVSSYLAFPSLPLITEAVYFCCTFPAVACG